MSFDERQESEGVKKVNFKFNKKGIGKNNNSGITLISLVITIIVLLILAGISIGMISGNNSIINQAGNAKTQTEIAHGKEILEQAIVAAMSKSKYGNVEKQYLDLELSKYPEVEGTEEGDDGIQVYLNGNIAYLVDVDGNVTSEINPLRIEEFKIEGTPVSEANIPVPTGFTHIEGTKDTGYVIQDGNGNEFVWIPVDKNQKITVKISGEEKITSIVLTDPYGDDTTLANSVGSTTYTNTDIQPTINGPYRLVVTTESGKTAKKLLYVHSLYAIDTFMDFMATDEYAQLAGYNSLQEKLEAIDYSTREEYMFDQSYFKGLYIDPTDSIDYTAKVQANGGFYVARYEATYRMINGEEKVGSIPSTNIRQSSSTELTNGTLWSCINQTNALNKSKQFNSALNSSLLTGAAWDRLLGWLYETGNKTGTEIAVNSTWGNMEGSIRNTGIESNAVSNNIYDIAGNLDEWTTQIEASSSYRSS